MRINANLEPVCLNLPFAPRPARRQVYVYAVSLDQELPPPPPPPPPPFRPGACESRRRAVSPAKILCPFRSVGGVPACGDQLCKRSTKQKDPQPNATPELESQINSKLEGMRHTTSAHPAPSGALDKDPANPPPSDKHKRPRGRRGGKPKHDIIHDHDRKRAKDSSQPSHTIKVATPRYATRPYLPLALPIHLTSSQDQIAGTFRPE